MDGLTGFLLMLVLGVCVLSAVILGASNNRRRMAAWLLASADAQDKIRQAKLAIRTDCKIKQADLEQRFTGRYQTPAIEEPHQSETSEV